MFFIGGSGGRKRGGHSEREGEEGSKKEQKLGAKVNQGQKMHKLQVHLPSLFIIFSYLKYCYIVFIIICHFRFDEFDEAIEEAIEEDIKEAEGGGTEAFSSSSLLLFHLVHAHCSIVMF